MCYEKPESTTAMDTGSIASGAVSFGARSTSLATKAFPSGSGSGSAAAVFAEQSNLSFKDKLVIVLEIPPDLVNHLDKGLKDAWAKYKAYLHAVNKLDELWAGGNLRNVFDRKPNLVDIKSLFKGKTQWHATYHRVFPRVSSYSEMVAWLEDHEDKLTDLDLWGVKKLNYNFQDLQTWLANDGKGLESSGASSEDIIPTKKSKKSSKGKEKESKSKKGKNKAGSSTRL